MSSFTPIVVLDGQEKIADAVEGIAPINVSHLAVGDGNGVPITPLDTMTSMVNEVWRGSITAAERDPNDPTKVIFQATIPLEAGPFTIREIAAFTSDGKLFAIGRYPEQFKPTAAQGAVSSIAIDFVVLISETAQVTVAVNPSQLVFLNNFSRIPFFAVDGIVNDPAADPTPGDMVIVGSSPNGAYAGHTGKFAQWNGSVWLIAEPPVGTVAGVPNGEYYRWNGAFWALWRASQTAPGLVSLEDFQGLPFYPEIETADGRLAVTDNGNGTITVNPNQVIKWRGFRRFSTSMFTTEQRTFAHVANKTYHLRFHPPGHGDAANIANWPNGRLVLKDLAASGYNPSSLAETNILFDSGYDDVLLGRLTTNGSNAPALKMLVNRHVLSMTDQTSLMRQEPYENDTLPFQIENGVLITLDWARKPRAAIGALSDLDSRVDQSELNVGIRANSRYDALAWYQNNHPSSPPHNYGGFSYELWA